MPQNTKMRPVAPRQTIESSHGTEVVRVLVGPKQREFTLRRKLLCSASPYFRDRLDATPASLTKVSHGNLRHAASTPSLRHATSQPALKANMGGGMLWLSTEVPEMFELFVMWLHQRTAFGVFMQDAIARLDPDSCSGALSESSHESNRRTLHWNLVRLHLFAAKTFMPALQDATMDALQDLYLRCDWEVSPAFVRFLYADCYAEHAFRLRKWAVAMVAWTIALQGGEPSGEWQRLLDSYPVLDHDYAVHLQKVANSRGANLCIKNPQLRLPANRLRSEERFFGFRQCSFHSHRSTVGEGACPHDGSAAAPVVDVRRTVAIPSLPSSVLRRKPSRRDKHGMVSRRDKEEVLSDESDHGVLSPVSVYIRDGFYLDCS